MKKMFPIVLTVLMALFFLTGCDFFRRLAGRPDSEWIKAKAEAIGREEAARQARLDSIAAAEKAAADSTAAADSVARANHIYRYCIVLGSFSSRENAERYLDEISGKGYPGTLIQFRNGSTAVGICPTDSQEEAKKSLADLQRQDFCPKGAWILERKQQ